MTGLLTRVLYRPSSPMLLLLLCGLPLLLAGWVLMSRDIMRVDYSVMDLLYSLAGAWQYHSGQTQHVDFHEPVGGLNFLLIWAGFHLVGFSPFAFLVGQIVAALGLFAVALAITGRRLPLMAGAVFILSVTLPALMPTDFGDYIGEFGFAMAYNRYGWCAIAIFCLILFAPPRPSRVGSGIDVACALLLLLAIFYVKITYFLVGLGALVLALIVSDHVRADRRVWIAVGLLAVGNAMAPYSHPYLADLHWAIISDLPQTKISRLVGEGLFGNGFEICIYTAGLITAIWLWRQGRATVGLPLTALFLIGAAFMLYTQNTQPHGLPLGAVVMFLLYGALGPYRGPSGWLVPAILLLPSALIALTAAGSFAAYFLLSVPSEKLWIVEDTRARGIAVPIRKMMEPDLRPQTGYLSNVLEATSFFSAGGYPPGRIRVIDRVNPLPFMLGYPPPRGGDLFWEPTSPPRPTEEILGDVDYVLVPVRWSSSPALTKAAHERFAPYLAAHFVKREETQSWILYVRMTPRG